MNWNSRILAGVIATATQCMAEGWTAWRGPRSDGTCVEQVVPMEWRPENATWKTAMPGERHALPIVWGDRVLTVAAEGEKRNRMLVWLDRQTGKFLGQELAISGPLEKIHQQNSYASGSPAGDGQRVCVVFGLAPACSELPEGVACRDR